MSSIDPEFLNDKYNAFALRRRMLLNDLHTEMRESVIDLFTYWMEKYPSIHHIELGVAEEEIEDENSDDPEDAGTVAIGFHVCTEDKELETRLVEQFRDYVLDPHWEMLVEVLWEPIMVGLEGGHDHDD
jgi:hypothetical protein